MGVSFECLYSRSAYKILVIIVGDITQRERFLGTLLGEATDRFPFFDLEPEEDTLRRWRQEGLPRHHVRFHAFPSGDPPLRRTDIAQLPLLPQSAPDLLHDPSAFDRHYNPDQRSRYAKNWVKQSERLHRQGRVIYVDASGGGLLQMLGVGDWDSLRSACVALVNRPRTVESLLNRITDFYCVCLERVLSKVTVDYASFYEPIASNTAPVISPAMFERFAIPGYRKVIDLLKRHQVPLRILCTTGGNLTPLLPVSHRRRHQRPLDQQHPQRRHGIPQASASIRSWYRPDRRH